MARLEQTGLSMMAAPALEIRVAHAPIFDMSDVLYRLDRYDGRVLLELEQSVLRACLVLAGGQLAIAGYCDLEFFVALDRFQVEQGLTGDITTDTVQAIIRAARRAVGASGPFASLKAAWFDAFVAPHFLGQAPGVALLIRALRRSE